ncbi:MAG: hypothetical protein N3C59_09620 [Azovibrio sp.]|nr:hypothetical protein [Azovibrio sp.]
MKGGRWLGWLLGAGLAAWGLYVLFQAYQMPEMLLDWEALRYCG